MMEALLLDAITIATKLFQAGLAMVGAVLVSRWLDARAGLHFHNVAATILKSPAAAADYYGKRLLAIALIVAATMF